MSIGKPRKRPENVRKVVCGDCGKIINIANITDTSRGYICPKCAKERGRKNAFNRGTNEDGVDRKADA